MALVSVLCSGVSERPESELESDDISTKLERSSSYGGVETLLGHDMTGETRKQPLLNFNHIAKLKRSTDVAEIAVVTAMPEGRN